MRFGKKEVAEKFYHITNEYRESQKPVEEYGLMRVEEAYGCDRGRGQSSEGSLKRLSKSLDGGDDDAGKKKEEERAKREEEERAKREEEERAKREE